MEKTVMVLGAGANAPYGMPTAWELRQLIIGRKPERFQHHFHEWDSEGRGIGLERLLRTKIQTSPQYMIAFEQFRSLFADSNVASIDTWLRENAEYEDLGKLFIGCILLACERHSESQSKWFGDWYDAFWNRIIKADVNISSLSIVTFNYDRSLQYFLNRSARAYYRPANAQTMVDGIHIDHVYGSLGGLSNLTPIKYGAVDGWIQAAQNIDLVRPGTAQKSAIQQKIQEANRLLFMGFGFDPDNLDALGITKDKQWDGEAIATCKNLPFDASAKAQRRFVKPITWGKSHWGCEEFFNGMIEL